MRNGVAELCVPTPFVVLENEKDAKDLFSRNPVIDSFTDRYPIYWVDGTLLTEKDFKARYVERT